MAKQFSTMYTNVGNMVQDTSSSFATLIKVWVNDKYLDISRRIPWSNLIDNDYTFTTKGDYTTGSGAVAATNGSTTVTVTGATFSTDGVVAGRYIKVNDDTRIRKISSVDSETQVTLDGAYAGTTTTTGTYTIYGQHEISLESDFEQAIYLANITEGCMVEQYKEIAWWNERYNSFQSNGLVSGIPSRYVIIREASKVLLDPPPHEAKTYAFPYKKSITDLSGDTDTVLIKDIEPLIELGAIAEAWLYKRQFQKASYYHQRYEFEVARRIGQARTEPNQKWQIMSKGYQAYRGDIKHLTGEIPYAI